MTWTGQTFSVGQILTAAQLNNLQADITALANNDAGAPSIVNGALSGHPWANSSLASHPWSRADLDTATGSASGTASGGGKNTVLLDAYSFFPAVESDDNGNVIVGRYQAVPSSPNWDTECYISFSGPAKPPNHDYAVGWRYIVA